jgi:hypothetical protein
MQPVLEVQMDKKLDQLSRRMGHATSRRQALKIFGAGLVGSALLPRAASAAPRTCVTCVCGVGRPCNPKTTQCTEQRNFPSPQLACEEACRQAGFFFCGGFTQSHCPQGCPA